MSRFRTSDAWQHANIIFDRYKNGESSIELAKCYNCSHALILKIIKSIDPSIVRSQGFIEGHKIVKTSDAWQHSGDIVERYKNGESSYTLSKEYGCSDSTIRRIIKSIDKSIIRVSVSHKNSISFSYDEEVDIVVRYKDGETITSISSYYNCSRSSIRRILVNHNIRIRSSSAARSESYSKAIRDSFNKGFNKGSNNQ